MDEYVAFVEETLRNCDPDHAVQQKALEERIKEPFRIREVVRAVPARTKDENICPCGDSPSHL